MSMVPDAYEIFDGGVIELKKGCTIQNARTKSGELVPHLYKGDKKIGEVQYNPESGQYDVLPEWMTDGKSHSAPKKKCGNSGVKSKQIQRDAEEAERRMATGEK